MSITDPPGAGDSLMGLCWASPCGRLPDSALPYDCRDRLACTEHHCCVGERCEQ